MKCLTSDRSHDGPVRKARVRRWWWLAVAGAIAPMIGAASSPADGSEYRLQPGDVIEVSLLGLPELRQRMPIQLDGTITASLVGDLKVAGLTPGEMRSKIKAALAGKLIRYQGQDGRAIVSAVEPDAIAATVSEYRAIYVSGDVSKPGEQSYRLGMTVRQALAVAGGADPARFRAINPAFDGADMRGEYGLLWDRIAQLSMREKRIEAELQGAGPIDNVQLDGAPIVRAALNRLVAAANETKTANEAAHRGELAFLESAVRRSDEQYRVLQHQQEDEEKGTQADLQDLQKVVDLFSRGQATSTRVNDARRAFLLASTRKLQTTVQLMSLKRQQDELTRQRVRVEDARRIALLREKEETVTALREARDRLGAVDAKLRYLGALRGQIGGAESRPRIAIVRKRDGGVDRIEADPDAELQPGDVIEVALDQNLTVEGPMR